ncbi:MAG: tetratricopeptide repeat protein [Candidatus Kapabacteria bacterium]|nr:tetratricopeptide repeat protein [Candidatus Kapabacteria bacterium]
MKSIIIIIMFAFAMISTSWSQSTKSFIREGNEKFKAKQFEEAEVKYRKALEVAPDYRATFNLGDALYKNEQYADAISKFSDIISQKPDKATTSNAYHNLGNAYYKSDDFEKSIAAYKNALKLNPQDNDTRHNLEMARRMLKQQQEQQQNKSDNKDDKDEDGDKEQEKQDGDKDQNQQKQDEQQGKNDQQKDEQQQNNDGDGKEQQGQEQQKNQQNRQKSEISKEDAERILEALKNEELDVQKKVLKKQQRRPSEKNW